MSLMIITGTGTGVGKTVVTAALAALAADRGSTVAVVKPAQTGVRAGELGDVDLVRDLSGVRDVHELARYADPLAPVSAARHAGLPTLDLARVASTVRELQADHRLVLVEGAGGLLVRYDDDGSTLADLARRLGAPVLVVTAAGLGALNATALTLEVMAHRGLELAGIVVGSWPARPDLAARSNITDLELLAARPLAGAVPEGSGLLDNARFRDVARASLAPALGGVFDAAEFRRRHTP